MDSSDEESQFDDVGNKESSDSESSESDGEGIVTKRNLCPYRGK